MCWLALLPLVEQLRLKVHVSYLAVEWIDIKIDLFTLMFLFKAGTDSKPCPGLFRSVPQCCKDPVGKNNFVLSISCSVLHNSSNFELKFSSCFHCECNNNTLIFTHWHTWTLTGNFGKIKKLPIQPQFWNWMSQNWWFSISHLLYRHRTGL